MLVHLNHCLTNSNHNLLHCVWMYVFVRLLLLFILSEGEFGVSGQLMWLSANDQANKFKPFALFYSKNPLIVMNELIRRGRQNGSSHTTFPCDICAVGHVIDLREKCKFIRRLWWSLKMTIMHTEWMRIWEKRNTNKMKNMSS